MHYNKPFSLRHWGHNMLCWIPMALIVYGACVGIAYAIDYARRTREQQLTSAELARQLAHAQLGALRMQLQPHFFFNTLNSISMMVRAGENRRAVEMLAGLGDVLRTLLRRSPALETTLSDELAFLRRYLEIEEVRFGERLVVKWELEPGVEEALVPPLLLQPLIENALRHGLDPRPDGGVLTVAAQRRDEALELVVADNGVGLRPGFSAHASTGLGLTNTRARLERMYGATAALEVHDAPDGGVRVRCKLPYHVQAVAVEGLVAHG
jgi:sensor histidine kinase YesM